MVTNLSMNSVITLLKLIFVEDCQYLATPHPFKGLRVYTCEPQGLKNASEHAYERLARIYGDMCRQERMTRMADGLFVLGETLEELESNIKEVLTRARLSGLTFKPSNISIAPVNTVLFGWQKVGDGWKPLSHTVSPLTKGRPAHYCQATQELAGVLQTAY